MSPFRVPATGGTPIGENGIEQQGAESGCCGRRSNRAYPRKLRAAVLEQVKARYEDFGPTLAAEHLASDDGLAVPAETLRRWMRQAGLWPRQRRRKPYRQRRGGKTALPDGE